MVIFSQWNYPPSKGRHPPAAASILSIPGLLRGFPCHRIPVCLGDLLIENSLNFFRVILIPFSEVLILFISSLFSFALYGR